MKNADNWLAQSDYGYEASEVAAGNGASDDESLKAGMDAIIKRIATPATNNIIRSNGLGIIEWFDAELSAIDPIYRGDPSYTHDAYWMKCEVQNLLESARKVFCGQLREGKAE